MPSDAFFCSSDTEWDTVDDGIRRQVLAHRPDLMLVRVDFAPGAVGAVHHHPHRQVTYVASGEFEILIGNDRRLIRVGDSFFADGDVPHGVTAIRAGTLIDCFTPARADFLPTIS